jgi:hypothetical protein
MACRQPAFRAAEETHQSVTAIATADERARLTRPTAFVYFPSGNAGDADLGAFSTPNRAIAIPHCRGRAGKHATSSNHRRGNRLTRPRQEVCKRKP